MTDPSDQRFLLEWARDINATNPFMDFHVHPFDVFSGDTGYRANPQVEGVFSKSFSTYRPVSLESRMGNPCGDKRLQDDVGAQRALLLASRLAYNHTGPKVFTDQIDLAGITKALLLPVARVPGTAGEMLDVLVRMFPKGGRFLLGCPFPVGIAPDELARFYRSACETKGICAIKIHPNLAGINPLSKRGRDLIEATLEAAGLLGLPVIVHVGCTPGLEPVESRDYGTLLRIASLDWSLSSAPVIFAHAGCYGLTEAEMIPLIPILKNLFEKYPNLLADTSALELNPLCLLMTRIDRNRLIFGSDSLYFPVWKAWVTFLQALRLTSMCPDDELIHIASVNPVQCLGTFQFSGK